jgi:signal transduction histidine kinase
MKYLITISGLILCLTWSCQKARRRHEPDWGPYRRAYSWLSKNRDSAFYYFNQAATSGGDSLPVATAYNSMAMIQTDAGDYFGAQESLLFSLRFLDAQKPEDTFCLTHDYNELGMNSVNLKDYTQAISFYDQALRYVNDPAYRSSILNNKAFAYQQQKNYAKAISLYKDLIRQSDGSGTGYARRLTNLATTRWLADPAYRAADELRGALDIRQKAGDLWGQNSSFAHLADYYLHSKPDSAAYFAAQMLAVAQRLHSPDDESEALQKLISLHVPGANSYFSRYLHLTDSLQVARNAAKNQFALIRYNVERSKAENLRLQKENAEKKYELLIRNILLIAVLLVLIAGTFRGRSILRKRKARQEQEKQEAILETRRKASKDVHDSLSNDIYLLMKRVKHDTTLDRAWLLKHTEFIYKRSRNISYELLADTDEFFSERIGELLMSFGTDDTKVSLVGNSTTLWQKVTPEVKLELKYILQELMVNMQKHSRAANVVVKFEAQGASGLIIYKDDGTGIPENTVHQNGLTNTGTRINAIRGRITFGDNDGKGLKIEISFPFI